MNIKFAIAMIAIAFAAPGLAHPGAHDEEEVASEKTIPEKAQDAVLREITRAKLDASWRKATPGTPEARTVRGVKQWVVPFTATTATKGAPSKLYVTLTDNGDFVTATTTSR